jgi:urea ABC transporter ATP-binding protein UrtE
MLSVRELHAGYGAGLVLHGMTFDVPDGETVALVGRNGVGKSTTLRAIAGHLRPRSGEIVFEGEAIARLPAHSRARRGIAYLPQGREIFARLTVEENLLVAAHRLRRKERALQLDTLFDEFPALRAKRRVAAGSLSGGQQQILALMRALVGNPRILLLDEVTEGVQPSIVHAIAEQIAEIRARRYLSVLLVEQNLDFVARLASEVNIVEKGTIADRRTIVDLLSDHAAMHQYLGV